MSGNYNLVLVGLSFLIAVAASYTALELARRVSNTEGNSATVWLATGSVSMGIGIWTMHFVGMLAFSLPMKFSYDIAITVLSLGVGILASAFAIYIASRKKNSYAKIGLSGLILGTGIASMHYTGMAAMEMDADVIYDIDIVALSVAIAVVAACAAIWIMFTLLTTSTRHLGKLKLGAAIIMGIAICGMHYTGMGAATYIPTDEMIGSDAPANNIWLAVTMGATALFILGATHLTIFFDSKIEFEKQHSQKSEQEAVQLSEILDESSNEIYFFDSESHRFVRANRGAMENTGYSIDELKNMTPLDLKPEITVARFNELLRPLRNGTRKEQLFETTHRRRDGSEYLAQVHLQISQKTEPPLFVAIIADITERKNLELQLSQSKKMESIGQLAAGIAHEINTPAQFVGDNTRFIKDAFADLLSLTASFGKLFDAVKNDTVTTELLQDVDTNVQAADLEYLFEEIPTAIDQSLDGIARISNIVLAMKEFSHPGGKQLESADLNKAITNTVTVASNEWKYLAEVKTDLATDLPPVMCKRQEINQVILNLVVNAAHAIDSARDEGSAEKGLISIVTRSLGTEIEISVSDSGCGIPDDIKDRIFDPFFTTKEVGKGTGQGLAMAYRTIVEQHGGSLQVDSTVGRGATFTIRLPVQSTDPLVEEVAA